MEKIKILIHDWSYSKIYELKFICTTVCEFTKTLNPLNDEAETGGVTTFYLKNCVVGLFSPSQNLLFSQITDDLRRSFGLPKIFSLSIMYHTFENVFWQRQEGPFESNADTSGHLDLLFIASGFHRRLLQLWLNFDIVH